MNPNVEVIAIDDSPIALKSIGAILSDHYTFRPSTDLREFATTLASGNATCTVVLIDVNMPGVTGDSLARILLGRRPSDMAFLFFSARPEAQLAELARRSGVDGYIAKGESPEVVLSKIQSAVDSILRPRVMIIGAPSNTNPELTENQDFDAVFAGVDESQTGWCDTVVVDLRDPDIKRRRDSIVNELQRSTSYELKVIYIASELPEYDRTISCLIGVDELQPGQLAQRVLEMLRVEPRRKLRVPIRLSRNDELFLAFTRNISTAGALIKSQRELEIGDEYTCSFVLAGQSLELLCRIVRNEGQQEERNFGIKFIDQEEERRSKIRRYLLSYWANQIIGGS